MTKAKKKLSAKQIAKAERSAANKAAWVPPQSRPRPAPRQFPPKLPGANAWNRDVADRILHRLRGGENMHQICRDSDMPYPTTVQQWRERANDEGVFSKQLDEALDALYEFWAAETMDISDDSSNDWMDREISEGRIERTLDHENIARSKLRIETRRWLLSKLKRDKYGEHIKQEVTGKDGEALPAPVLNVIIDGVPQNVGSSSSGSTNDIVGPTAPSETGTGLPVKGN